MTIRFFARGTAGSITSPVREFTEAELADRDGGGDELSYDETADTFSYALGSGISPQRTVPNPVPGDPLKGADLVSRLADADWFAIETGSGEVPLDPSTVIVWVGTAALASNIIEGLRESGKDTGGQSYWMECRDRMAEMFEEGHARLEVDANGRRIRWASGLSFDSPPSGALRLATGQFV